MKKDSSGACVNMMRMPGSKPWIDGEGWVQVDPTAAVAPERIQSRHTQYIDGGRRLLLNEPMSLARLSHIGMINWLRLKMEYANYLWQDWVVNYDRSSQYALFSRWLGRDDLTRVAGLLAGLAVAIFSGNGGRQLFLSPPPSTYAAGASAISV